MSAKLREHLEELITLTDDEFNFINSFFTLKKVKKHQYLVQDGNDVKCEFLVLSGIYKVFFIDEDGKEYIVQFARENWWMTDYNAFFNSKPATMNVECMQEGEVLCLTLEGREKLASELHKMEHFFRVKLTNGFVAQQKRISSLLSSTPQQRYEEFSKLYPNMYQLIPKKYIAEYLGVSRETLSRLYSGNK